MPDGYLAITIPFVFNAHVSKRNVCVQIYLYPMALDCD